jgi:hypothetical protein
MTRTEERLRDALGASAGRVRDERLRPLPAPEPRAGRHAAHRHSIRAWLTPLAAAVSVVLIVGVVLALTGGRKPASPAGPPGSGVTSIPGYFAAVTEVNGANQSSAAVYSTSTGDLVGKIPTPDVPGWTVVPAAVAAAPDDRTFYAEYDAIYESQSSYSAQTWIYRLRINGSGQPVTMTRIKGGVFDGAVGVGGNALLAVSPDGTKLALTADTGTGGVNSRTQAYGDKVVVIDLPAGHRSVWQGGLYRAGTVFTIPSLSWTPDGNSLVYLALWCHPPAASNLCTRTYARDGYRDMQVRSLSVRTGGGTLGRGAVLLRQSTRYPVIAAAVAGPDGSDLTVLVLSGPPNASGEWTRVAVEHVEAGTGILLGVDYSGPTAGYQGRQAGSWLSVDPANRALLLSYWNAAGVFAGWIGQGRFHPLPISQPYPGLLIPAW